MIFTAASWLLALGGTWLGWWVGLAYTMQTAPQGLAPSNMALAVALPVGSLLTGGAALFQKEGRKARFVGRSNHHSLLHPHNVRRFGVSSARFVAHDGGEGGAVENRNGKKFGR